MFVIEGHLVSIQRTENCMMKPSIVILAGIVVASFLSFHEVLGEPIRVFPKIDTFLSSPRPDGLGDGARTCCDTNPVPDGELVSSHNVVCRN